MAEDDPSGVLLGKWTIEAVLELLLANSLSGDFIPSGFWTIDIVIEGEFSKAGAD